jgi:hypothetical protein
VFNVKPLIFLLILMQPVCPGYPRRQTAIRGRGHVRMKDLLNHSQHFFKQSHPQSQSTSITAQRLLQNKHSPHNLFVM